MIFVLVRCRWAGAHQREKDEKRIKLWLLGRFGLVLSPYTKNKEVNSMEYKNELRKHCDNCEKDGLYKECNLYTGIGLPVELEPEVTVGDIEVLCCGDPTVKIDSFDGKCHKLMITQKFFIKIPLCYKMNTKVGSCDCDCKDKK
jgi:hypothetical protein